MMYSTVDDQVRERVVGEMREWFDEKFPPDRFPQNEFDVQVAECRKLIQRYFPSKALRIYKARGSYGLKHDFERVRGQASPPDDVNTYHLSYVFEGCAIAAMAMEGFSFSHIKNLKKGNVCFNISKREFEQLCVANNGLGV